MARSQFSRTKKTILVSIIFVIAALQVASAADIFSREATPCCPNIVVNPVYDYYGNQIWPPEGESFDPYYMFPVYCSCPFLDDVLNRPWYKYFPYNLIVVNNPSSVSTSVLSSDSTFSAGFSEQSITYMSDNIDVPDKSDLIKSKSKSGNSLPVYSKKLLVT